MIRSLVVFASVLFMSAGTPVAAADWPGGFVMARPVGPSPYYLVNQGPVLSGPGIMIIEIGLTPTDLKRAYPFIGTSDDLTPLVATTDFYGVVPATVAPRRWSRSRAHARRSSRMFRRPGRW